MVTSQVVAVHAGEQPEIGEWTASIFLAGPMPREVSVPSWRPVMLKAIEEAWSGPGTLTVFVPEARNWQPLKYDHHQWEDHWLSIADVICFWVPRDMQRLPGMNTNIEFGRWEKSGRFIFGAPPDAVSVDYLRECAAREGAAVADSIEQTVAACMAMIGPGALRSGGHRDVPLLLWRAPAFQLWLETRAAHGKSLRGGRLLWVHDIRPGIGPQYWAFRAELSEFDGEQTTTAVVVRPDGHVS